jgi:uncharacterized protein
MLFKLSFEYQQESELIKQLQAIPHSHRLVLAASICERLLPNYYAFARESQGNPETLRIALDKVWEIINGSPANTIEISRLIEMCRSLPPHEDDCERYDYEASLTISAICFMLEACLSSNLKSIIEILEITGTIIADTVIIEKEEIDPDWDKDRKTVEVWKEIATHVFAVRERIKQNKTFQQLKKAEILDSNFLQQLKESSNPSQKSTTDLC